MDLLLGHLWTFSDLNCTLRVSCEDPIIHLLYLYILKDSPAFSLFQGIGSVPLSFHLCVGVVLLKILEQKQEAPPNDHQGRL